MNGGKFVAEEGVIKLHGGRGWLRSADEYDDFTFRLDLRFMKPNQDSGVFLRASKEGKDWPDRNYQVQAMNNNSMAAIFGADHKRNAELVAKLLRAPEEWNTLDIECLGKKITVKLNGKAVTTSEAANNPKGYLGLQGEGGELEFRNLRVKEIRKSE